MESAQKISSKGRWSVRATILILLMYEFQSPRIAGDIRLASVTVTFFALIFLLARLPLLIRNLRALFRPPLLFLTLYFLINIASAFWSYDPLNSLLHGTTLLIFLFLATTYSHLTSDEFAGEVVRTVSMVALTSWAMVVVAKNIAVLPDIVWRINGPMIHPQRLSLVLSLAIICLAVLRANKSSVIGKRASIFYFGLLLVTLAATQTRAFTFFCAVTVGYIAFWHVSLICRIGLVSVLVASLSAAVLNWDAVLNSVSRDGSNTMTLSGRTVAWENGIAMIRESPMLGYGFASFNTDLTKDFFSSGYVIPHAHNTWINAAFETGLIGACILTLFFLFTLVNRRFFSPSYSEALVLWVMLSGLTGLVFGGKINPAAALAMIFIAQSSLQRGRNAYRFTTEHPAQIPRLRSS